MVDTNNAQAGAPVPARGWTEAGLAVMIVIWGTNFAVVKHALDAFLPLGFNALRYVLASALVYAVLRSQGPLRLPYRADLPRIIMLGLVGNTIYQIAFVVGLSQTRAGNASLMLALVPVIVLAMNRWRGHRLSARAWAGAVLSVIGVALVSGGTFGVDGFTTLRGDLILIGASFVWAVYTVEATPLIEKYGSVQTTAWTLWVGALGIFAVGGPSLIQQDWSRVGHLEWGGLLYSALLSIGLAYLIWYRGVERIGSSGTAVFSNLTPVVALITGAIWLGEKLTPISAAGAAMVVIGVMMVRGGSRRPGTAS